MAELITLDALQAFHRELLALYEGAGDGLENLDNELLVEVFEKELEKFWERPQRSEQSRCAVKSGTRSPYMLVRMSNQSNR